MIVIGPFGGIAPKIEPHLLPDTGAQEAMNCLLDSGSLRPLKDVLQINVPAKAGTLTTIYRYGLFWFHWLENVNIVRSPLPTTESIVVYTGEGTPKLTYASIATSGGTEYPQNNVPLGVPLPASAPVATLAGTETSDDPLDVAYLITYICTYGGIEQEGAPSSPSDIVTFQPGQSVDLTFSATPGGDYNFTAICVYRSVGGTIKRIATLAASATTFTDDYGDSDFGVDLVTDNWYPPPDDLHGLISLPGGVLAGISGKNVCFSVPYQVHAWPPDWRKVAKDTPVALGGFGNTVIVLTDGRPEVGVGTTDPENLVLELIEMDQSCTHPRAAVDLGYSVCFPTPDGLFIVGQGETRNATKDIFRKDQFDPPLFAAGHDGKYYGFRATGGFIFNPATGEWSEHDITATAAWQDYETDHLYIVDSSGDISLWEGGVEKSYTWKSKEFRTPPASFAAVRVAGEATINYKADGVSQSLVTKTDETFRLPAAGLARKHEVTLTGTGQVDTIVIGTSMRDLA